MLDREQGLEWGHPPSWAGLLLQQKPGLPWRGGHGEGAATSLPLPFLWVGFFGNTFAYSFFFVGMCQGLALR